MAQTTNAPKCNNDFTNCPFLSKAVCVTAFIPTKSLLDYGMFSEGAADNDAPFKFSVGVYHSDGTIAYIVNFTNPLKALRYAYILKEREQCPISKNTMDLLKAAIKAYKAKGYFKSQQKAEPIPEAPKEEPEAESIPEAPKEEPKEEPAPEAQSPEPTEAEPKKRKAPKMPIIKQYEEMKKKHPDAVLLFRVGDFYEVFKKDAVIASEILGITLTRRKEGRATIELAGFPHHALDTYLPKLVRAGKRVAICEQAS